MAIERFHRRMPVFWEPFTGIRGLQDEMNRLFADYFGQTTETTAPSVVPALDLVETKDSVKVKVELPGIKKEDVEIALKDDVLTIKGEKKTEKEEKDENRHFVERVYGSFSRSVVLPARVKADKVKAAYKDGVLEVVLPKAEEEKAREVQVKVE